MEYTLFAIAAVVALGYVTGKLAHLCCEAPDKDRQGFFGTCSCISGICLLAVIFLLRPSSNETKIVATTTEAQHAAAEVIKAAQANGEDEVEITLLIRPDLQ